MQGRRLSWSAAALAAALVSLVPSAQAGALSGVLGAGSGGGSAGSEVQSAPPAPQPVQPPQAASSVPETPAAAPAPAVKPEAAGDPAWVRTVKAGVLPEYSDSITVGAALDNYYDCLPGTVSWRAFKTKKGARMAEFTCDLNALRTKLIHDEGALGLMTLSYGIPAGLLVEMGELPKGPSFQKLIESAAYRTVDFKRLGLNIQFALSAQFEGIFDLSSISLHADYTDGLSAEMKLLDDTLQAVYDDQDLFDASAKLYTLTGSTTRGWNEVLRDLINARSEAAGGDIKVAAFGPQ